VLPALEDAGYVRTFEAGAGPIGNGRAVPGCAGIEVDLVTGAVRAPAGVLLDLGGIGKGAAVDALVEHLEPVAPGGVVDLGGDLRAWGRPADGDGWPIAVEDVRDGSQAALLWLAAGAVATSTSLRRRWADGPRTAHHLIDPRTGRPSRSDLVAVTVVAGRATGADVLAKAALVSGSTAAATDLLAEHEVAGLLVPEVGAPVPVGSFDALCYPEVAA
jgi:thiamine biosynthesis lipoprotein